MATQDIIFLYDNTLSALKEQAITASSSGYYILSNPSPALPVNNWVLTLGKGILDYNVLINKPSIEGITLSGDLFASDFGFVTVDSLTGGFVPYEGAVNNVDLGDFDLSANNIIGNNIEYVENKVSVLSSNISDDFYPSTKAVKDYSEGSFVKMMELSAVEISAFELGVYDSLDDIRIKHNNLLNWILGHYETP